MSNVTHFPPPHPYGPVEPGPRGPRPMEAPAENHPLQFLGTLHKRRGTASIVFVAVMAFSVLYVSTEIPQYQATVQVLIQSEAPNVVDFKQVSEQARDAEDFYQTQFRLLASRSVAKRTMDDLHLWDLAEFGGRSGAAPPSTLKHKIGRRLRAAVAFVQRPLAGAAHEAPDPAETAAQTGGINAFLSRLSVSPYRFSGLADVRFRTGDPRLSARIVNAHVRHYIQQQLEFKFTLTKEASDWLAERLAEQRRIVEDSESAVQRYRAVNDSVSLDDRQSLVGEALSTMTSAATQAKTARLEKETSYRLLAAGARERRALRNLPAVLGNPLVQQLESELVQLERQRAQLLERFGDKHPEMLKLRTAIDGVQSRLDAEMQRIVEGARNEYEAALAQERTMTAALEVQKRQALAVDQKSIEYGVLVREAESNRQIFQSLLQRAKETGVSGELRMSHMRIVDDAEVPLAPLSARLQTVTVGSFGGLLAAIMVVVAIEFLDRRIKSPEELKAILGIYPLGLVPMLTKRMLTRSTGLISREAPPRISEAFRGIRTNIIFAQHPDGPHTIVITSPEPGEGKTFVTSNIAVALAQTGAHTLLVDADMRRGRLHTLFGERQSPGLADMLAGDATWVDSVRASDVENLSVLPAGTFPHNPAELLGSPAFIEFLTAAERKFDWILIDSPPVMAVTDACVIANVVSGVVFVVGSEMTRRQVAQAALEQLAAARAPVIGGVLNRVDFERNSYYYAKYYRRDYAAYYGTATKKAA